MHQGRQPPGRNSSATPTDSTSRQEMSLDGQTDAVETNTTSNEDRLARKMKTQIN